HAGEYAPAAGVDDISIDYLDERTTAKLPDAVSGFARHWKQRRRVDSAWTFAAILRALGPGSAKDAVAALEDDLAKLEAKFETDDGGPHPDLADAEQRAAQL